MFHFKSSDGYYQFSGFIMSTRTWVLRSRRVPRVLVLMTIWIWSALTPWWSWEMRILLEQCQKPVWGCGNQTWDGLTCAASPGFFGVSHSCKHTGLCSLLTGHRDNLIHLCCSPQSRKLCYLLVRVDIPGRKYLFILVRNSIWLYDGSTGLLLVKLNV